MPRRKYRKQKPTWLTLVVLVVAAIFYIYANREEIFMPAPAPAPAVEGELLVRMLNVGQADAFLLQLDGKNMLIDAGKNDTSAELKNELIDYGVDKLDFVIATHPHEDHIGGMAAVINSFKVIEMLMPSAVHTSRTFENMLDAMERNNVYIAPYKTGDVFMFGDASVTIVAPNSSEYEDLNNYSLSVRVVYGQNSFLFTGDAEALSEQEMLDSGFVLKSDVLKIGHHGSGTSTSKAFLSAVSPKIALISCGEGNSYNHPHKDIIERLESSGAIVYRTDIDGGVTLSSDGVNIISVTQKEDT